MQNPGKGRSRLLVFVALVFAAVLAPAGAAQADDVFVDNLPQSAGTQNRVDTFGPAGEVSELTGPQFNLTWSGLQHLEPGSQVNVSMNANGPQNITAEDQTFTVPSTWSSTSPSFTFRPKMKFTMPDTLGWHEQYVSFTITGTCAGGFGDCIAGNPLIVHVHSESRPHPVSDVSATPAADGGAIDISWSDSPSISQVTSYRVDRFATDPNESKWWHGLDKNETTFRDSTAQPGRRYCYYVTAWQEDPVAGHSGSSTRSEIVCTRINRAPTTPGAPSPDPTLSGAITNVSWSPATDPDGDGVMYELQHKNSAPDAQWSTYWKGFSSTSLAVVEQGGTWQYRVRAFDNDGATSDWSAAGPEHKADTTGPGVPKLNYDKEPSDSGWFKDSVTVSFSGAVDSLLPDGSEGGGVAEDGYPDPVTLSTSGTHELRPQVFDRVGNGGAMVTQHVRVDATAPKLTVSNCPTDPVLERTPVTVNWSASDGESGLATPAAGDIAVDTSTPGAKTVAIPAAADRVGHETTTEPCEFEVYANTPPAAPSGLVDASTPRRDGELDLSWDEATDPDLGAGDSITYTLEQRDEDSDWTTIAAGLTTPSHHVDVGEDDGTYRFRVRTVDSFDATSDAVEFAPVTVDREAPTTRATCPTGTLIVGQPATAPWTAEDEGSGLETPASGTLTLDTSSPGPHTTTGPAPIDNVGHTGAAPKCTYTVAYRFVGFLSPVNGDAVNVGKTGRTYPIKWRLERHDGSLISDTEAQALVPAMVAGQRQTDCDFGLMETDTLEDAATGGTELRYDAGADQFIYNYKAPQTLGCYVLGIRNADGANTKQVNFRFTR